jgi:hypothetical protein
MAEATKTVASPCKAYDFMEPTWAKSRAVCNGERAAKIHDRLLDTIFYSNLLIPFSRDMTSEQYDFYKSEAELPGIVAQFTKMLIGGLLRKQPVLELPPECPAEAKDWLMNNIGADDCSMITFLDAALWEDLQTSRAWVLVDYPSVGNTDSLSKEELDSLKPYPVLYKAETIINWDVSQRLGKPQLQRLIVKGETPDYTLNEFHATMVPTVWVHELVDGYYQIRIYKGSIAENNDQTVKRGDPADSRHVNHLAGGFELKETITNIVANGERLDKIPAWPLNGDLDPKMPMIMPLIDKEISLYNKLSRRNHLLYGAATYTPVISSDMTDDEFDDVVSSGLGGWIRLHQGDTADILATPTDALKDMQATIEATISEMARLGVRMLTTENVQSGVALELRNAGQTAQLSVLSTKVSCTMQQVICFMINWRYDLQLKAEDIVFKLSEDFNPTPLGADWLRLATEWYQNGLIPRSVWLSMLKQNDMIASEYNDEDAKQEINGDEMVMPPMEKQQEPRNGI